MAPRVTTVSPTDVRRLTATCENLFKDLANLAHEESYPWASFIREAVIHLVETLPVYAADIVALATQQRGKRYVYGAEVDLGDPDPAEFDCSEFVQWICAQFRLDPAMPDGSYIQARFCRAQETMLPVTAAFEIPGTLLFSFSSDPFTGGRPKTSHVAIMGYDDQTIEARSQTLGVDVFPNARGRTWTHAAKIPSVKYA